MNYKISQNT